ncbi:MAG: DUF995 domain-containing protein [Shinella sp.]|nr:DUF995 domain-containing protein [Shinella sp.]MDX3975774.1 DUF995 domain-containing protein [Shinella sp.]
MRRYGVRMLAVVASTAFILAGTACVASSQEDVLPAEARAMTALEMYKLYRDKSWKWDNGAGLMKDADRHFSAWSNGDKGKSWAEGSWAITETGLMCLKATWYTEKGSFPAKTCFSHRIASGTIYQKREPDGGWYVFRHAMRQKEDEASKLIAGDLVSHQRDTIKAALGVAELVEQ